eukprot:jgi/Botrbrau1/3689/Bobra.0008s0016.1
MIHVLQSPFLGVRDPNRLALDLSHKLHAPFRQLQPTARYGRKLRVGICPGAPFGGFRSRAKSFASRITPTCLNIVFVAAEVAPWSKTGGLGDVVGGLPIELAKRGHKVMSIAPRYDQYEDAWDTSVVQDINGEEVRYFHAKKDGVERVWIDHPFFLAKVWGKTGAKLYGKKSGADYVDNPKRFMIFCKAALEALEVLPMSFGTGTVIVANDWHSAMVPVLLKEIYQKQGRFLDTRVALCIHNIAFQGRFKPEIWPVLGLPDHSKPLFDFEDGIPRTYTEDEPDAEEAFPQPVTGKRFQKLNWLKAGILTADKVVTVSPHYAMEITSGEQLGVELQDVLRASGPVVGIVNGMDTGDWSPMVDKYIRQRYGKEDVSEGKAKNKEAVQTLLGLPKEPSTPLFVFIGRLEEQKGVDILVESLKYLKDEKLQVAILGTGSPALERKVKAVQGLYPENVSVTVKFDTPLAHKLFAGGDYMLVPSRFEPCGLIQMQAMQYGTVPLVSSTGGLVDTVEEGVTGFHMGIFDTDGLVPEDAQALASAVKRAVEVYGTPKFESMRKQCIQQDLSWAKPARVWEHSLDKMINLPSREPVALDAAGQPLYVPVEPRATLAGTSPPQRSATGASSSRVSSPLAPPSESASVAPLSTPKLPTATTVAPEPASGPTVAPPVPSGDVQRAGAKIPGTKVSPPPPVAATVVGPSTPKTAANGAVDGMTAVPAARAPDGAVRAADPAVPLSVSSSVAPSNGSPKEETETVEQEMAAAETPVNRLRQGSDRVESKSEVDSKSVDSTPKSN